MRRKIPSTQSLMCFESAARHASYTHAAQELFLTQSAISRQIQHLEELLEVQLFSRTRHGVELTAAGQQYYESIKPLLISLEQATLDVIEHKGQGGTLKLGVVPTFATRWLLPKLHRFQQRHPEITVHLETSTRPFLFHETIFDAAIYAGTPEQVAQWPGITSHFLMHEDVVAVCSPSLIKTHLKMNVTADTPHLILSAEQLLQLPLLQQTTRPTIWQDWFELHQVKHPNPLGGQRHELFSMLAVAAKHDMGMALIPQMLIETELANGELVKISDQKLERRRAYHLIHAHNEHSTLIARFVNWMKEELQQEPIQTESEVP
ncbi:LysR family transcriptional regulator [Acinetobacter schindleri]|uniref:LysR substrate-binding domain-containing protein n=1 Tax=Acinetobacter schindleri TaxID=108981 RepID=UPI0013B08A66|nr:LysR substrate-binding domain-containing protein [Acinetobacter schindleri]QIC61955.1 LysR family transcriptional regulator [Acinetobacter schindleri]